MEEKRRETMLNKQAKTSR